MDELLPTTEEEVWAAVREHFQVGGRHSVLELLSGMCRKRLEFVLCKTLSCVIPSSDVDVTPQQFLESSVGAALNTSLSYLFGAPYLVDRLVEGTRFERDGAVSLDLYRQFQSFLRFFSGVSGGLEYAFQDALIKNAQELDAVFVTYAFRQDHFSLIDNNGSPVLAMSKEALDRVLQDKNTPKGPRLGCPALFVGVLPQYFGWINSILQHYYWDFEKFDANVTDWAPSK